MDLVNEIIKNHNISSMPYFIPHGMSQRLKRITSPDNSRDSSIINISASSRNISTNRKRNTRELLMLSALLSKPHQPCAKHSHPVDPNNSMDNESMISGSASVLSSAKLLPTCPPPPKKKKGEPEVRAGSISSGLPLPPGAKVLNLNLNRASHPTRQFVPLDYEHLISNKKLLQTSSIQEPSISKKHRQVLSNVLFSAGKKDNLKSDTDSLNRQSEEKETSGNSVIKKNRSLKKISSVQFMQPSIYDSPVRKYILDLSKEVAQEEIAIQSPKDQKHPSKFTIGLQAIDNANTEDQSDKKPTFPLLGSQPTMEITDKPRIIILDKEVKSTPTIDNTNAAKSTPRHSIKIAAEEIQQPPTNSKPILEKSKSILAKETLPKKEKFSLPPIQLLNLSAKESQPQLHSSPNELIPPQTDSTNRIRSGKSRRASILKGNRLGISLGGENDQDKIHRETKLKTRYDMAMDESHKLMKLARTLEPFENIEEWKKSLEGQRPQMGDRLFRKLASQFPKRDLDLIREFFFVDEETVIRPIEELYAARLLRLIFAFRTQDILMDKDRKAIAHINEVWARNPASPDLILDLSMNKNFDCNHERLELFPKAAVVFFRLLTDAKCMYFHFLSDKVRNGLQKTLNRAGVTKLLQEPMATEKSIINRANNVPEDKFIGIILRGLGREQPEIGTSGSTGPDWGKRVSPEEKMFNENLREMLSDMRGLAKGEDVPVRNLNPEYL